MSQTGYQLAIIGFGTVGEGVYHAVETSSDKLTRLLGKPLHIPAVLVKDGTKKRNTGAATRIVTQLDELLREKPDIVVEATPDAETGFPYVRRLLELGITVVTANKEMVANHGEVLADLAEKHDAQLLFEGAVAGGIPLLNTLRHTLKTNEILQVNGILNGTSNYVLTKMQREGTPFQNALKEAQEKGYAEAVPDKDVDGWDASFKTAILSQWIYGQAPVWKQKEPAGIREITAEDLALSAQAGGSLKHVATLRKDRYCVTAAVRPCFLFRDHPLYAVEGVNNGVHIEGSIVGDLLLQGPGAGKGPTASAVVEDVVNVLNKTNGKVVQNPIPETSGSADELHSESQEEFYLLTGNEGLSRRVSVYGLSVTGKFHESKNTREGIVIKAKPESVQEFKRQYKEQIGIYPVLAAEDKIVYYFEQQKKSRAVSF
jgi:homoserine dehydrogenase